jgi:hypothetical protein
VEDPRVPLTLKIAIAGDSLELNGDVSILDARALLERWLAAVTPADQHRINTLTARLAAANTRLQRDVAAAAPS